MHLQCASACLFLSINACCVNGLGNGGLFADHCFVSNNIKGNNQNKPQKTECDARAIRKAHCLLCLGLAGPTIN